MGADNSVSRERRHSASGGDSEGSSSLSRRLCPEHRCIREVLRLQNPNQDRVLLPHLRRLEGSGILDYIEAPLLETLYSSHSLMLQASITPFIRRCGCPLTKLVLLYCQISSGVIPLLQSLPSLTYLLIGPLYDTLEIQTSLLDALTLTRASYLCPNLTSFLYGCPPTDDNGSTFPRQSFFTMVQSRVEIDPGHPNRPSRLTFLRIFQVAESSFPSSDDILVRLETLKNRGLDFAFLDYQDFEGLKARGDLF